MLKCCRASFGCVIGLIAIVGCEPPDREGTGTERDRPDARSGVFADARPPIVVPDGSLSQLPDAGLPVGPDPGLPTPCERETDCPAVDDCCFIFLEPPGVCIPGSYDVVLGCFPDLE